MAILKVSKEEWQNAQKGELQIWLGEDSRGCNNDWNNWWFEKFEGYSTLPQKINRAIELGCGPYTNIKWILKTCKASEIYLSDPLIIQYSSMEHGWIKKAPLEYPANFIMLNSPVEKISLAEVGHFNLVVMINVLDHVMDATICMDIAMKLVGKKGFIVIGQDLTNQDDERRIGKDPLHPIRVDQEFMDKQLVEFKPIFKKILPRHEGRTHAHCGTYLFIGQKGE